MLDAVENAFAASVGELADNAVAPACKDERSPATVSVDVNPGAHVSSTDNGAITFAGSPAEHAAPNLDFTMSRPAAIFAGGSGVSPVNAVHAGAFAAANAVACCTTVPPTTAVGVPPFAGVPVGLTGGAALPGAPTIS